MYTRVSSTHLLQCDGVLLFFHVILHHSHGLFIAGDLNGFGRCEVEVLQFE
jgi:hypothetical protein